MKIESEEFRQAILTLDAGLKSGMENGRTYTEMQPEYIKQCHELLLSAAQSDSWDEIADVIAFFLFAGGSQQILFHMLVDTYNKQCIPTINNAALKVAALEQASTYLRSELKNYGTNRARKAAQAKLANDPKQQAKDEVKQCWLLWQEKPLSYKSKAAFAKDMLEKFGDILESQKVIEGWCRDWEKMEK